MADCRKCKHNYKMPGDEPRCNLMCDGESDFEPITNYIKICSMSIQEMTTDLVNIFEELFEDGVPSPEWMEMWLQSEAE